MAEPGGSREGVSWYWLAFFSSFVRFYPRIAPHFASHELVLNRAGPIGDSCVDGFACTIPSIGPAPSIPSVVVWSCRRVGLSHAAGRRGARGQLPLAEFPRRISKILSRLDGSRHGLRRSRGGGSPVAAVTLERAFSMNELPSLISPRLSPLPSSSIAQTSLFPPFRRVSISIRAALP